MANHVTSIDRRGWPDCCCFINNSGFVFTLNIITANTQLTANVAKIAAKLPTSG